MRPQYCPPPVGVQLIGVQFVVAQTPGTLAPQVDPVGQLPHASVPPHPSPTMPQYRTLPELQVSGTHPASVQTPEVQPCPAGQAPQSSPRPQPSPTVPQYLPFGG